MQETNKERWQSVTINVPIQVRFPWIAQADIQRPNQDGKAFYKFEGAIDQDEFRPDVEKQLMAAGAKSLMSQFPNVDFNAALQSGHIHWPWKFGEDIIARRHERNKLYNETWNRDDDYAGKVIIQPKSQNKPRTFKADYAGTITPIPAEDVFAGCIVNVNLTVTGYKGGSSMVPEPFGVAIYLNDICVIDNRPELRISGVRDGADIFGGVKAVGGAQVAQDMAAVMGAQAPAQAPVQPPAQAAKPAGPSLNDILGG